MTQSDDSASSNPYPYPHGSFGGGGGEEDPPAPEMDEKDVLVLTEENFSQFIEKNRHVMVDFYAPWCRHSQSLAPEYAAAATELKGQGDGVALAKVDVTVENELCRKYDVKGYPTVVFFVDGVHSRYYGERTKDAIVTWIKKKIVQNITTTEEAEKILTSDNIVVLGFLDSLVGAESQELAAASKPEDGVNFYQTVNPNVAKLFHIDPKAKRPSLVLLKNEAEKVSSFDGQFTKSGIVDFVSENKLPLVNIFTRENAPSIFLHPIKRQILLFATKEDSEKYLPIFGDTAKLFKGKFCSVFLPSRGH